MPRSGRLRRQLPDPARHAGRRHSFVLGGIRFEGSRVLAGVVGLVVTLLLHLMLTRTALGSRMLAVSEDATAAQLMGIRPQRMQALAWGLAGAATGIAGALIATFFYTSPTVGETLGHRRLRHRLVRRLRQRAGRAGRRPDHRRGRIAVGLSDRPGLQGRRRLRAVRAGAVVPAAGPDGQGNERRGASCRSRWSSCWCWPIRCWPATAGLRAAGRAGAAGGDRRLGLEHRRRLCRPGLGRPRGVLRRRRLRGGDGLHPSRAAADRRRAARHAVERAASPP